MKYFNVSAILNAQTKRIETNVTENTARFTDSILKQNEKKLFNLPIIPEDPIDYLDFTSEYLNMKKRNKKEYLEKLISKENIKKLDLLQISLKNIIGGGIKIFIPDLYEQKTPLAGNIYTKDDSNNALISNKGNTIEKFFSEQTYYSHDETVHIKINDEYRFMMDNSGSFGKEIFEIFYDKYILVNIDFNEIDIVEIGQETYDGLRIWTGNKEYENAELFVFGVKNFGAVFCNDILRKAKFSDKKKKNNSFQERNNLDLIL